MSASESGVADRPSQRVKREAVDDPTPDQRPHIHHRTKLRVTDKFEADFKRERVSLCTNEFLFANQF